MKIKTTTNIRVKTIPFVLTIAVSALVAIYAYNKTGIFIGVLAAFIPWWLLTFTSYFKEWEK